MEILPGLRRIIKTSEAVRREERLRREYQTKDKPAGWETTNPLNHNPDNFRYIVHTTSKASLDGSAWETYAKKLGPKREMHGNAWEVLIADFLSRSSTSCTIIDEVHRGTYKWDVIPQGFILDVPEENIVALDPTDLGTMNHIQDRQKRGQLDNIRRGIELKHNTPSAQAFLESCMYDFRNEVLIDGIGPEGRQIRIAGIFLITDPILGTPLHDLNSRSSWHPSAVLDRIFSHGMGEEKYRISSVKKQYQQTKDLAKFLQVPIIRIPAPLGAYNY